MICNKYGKSFIEIFPILMVWEYLEIIFLNLRSDLPIIWLFLFCGSALKNSVYIFAKPYFSRK